MPERIVCACGVHRLNECYGENPTAGVWVAYWSDNSGKPVIFRSEIEALRWALDNHMQATFVTFGEGW